LGTGRPSTVYQNILKLAERDLVTTFGGPPQAGSRQQQLVLPTNLGLAVLALRFQFDQRELVRSWRLGARATGPLIRQLPAVLCTYRLLALLARARDGWSARLLLWQQPWRPGRLGNHASRAARLPACASLEWQAKSGERQAGTYVLVPDTGNVPPVVYTHALAQLARHQAINGSRTPVVTIATTSERRVAGWSAALDSVADSRRGGRLESRIYTWSSWYAKLVGVPTIDANTTDVWLPQVQRTWSDDRVRRSLQVPRPIDVSRVNLALGAWGMSPGARTALDVIGRHPFLSHARLAEVLGRDRRWARARRGELVHRGLVQVVPREELPRAFKDEELLEATVAGLSWLAGSMGLTFAQAVRYHGLAGGGQIYPIGTRRALHAQLAHTVGSDGIFATIAGTAGNQRNCELVEWRNATACAHGRMRPDGYGLLRVAGREFGFFLEFDLGTVRPGALRAKFAAYQRYMSSPRAERDFTGFPTILVVTSGPSGEQRIINAVRAIAVAEGRRLPILVTTIEWLNGNADGAFGSLWLVSDWGRRRQWPELTGDSVSGLSHREQRGWRR
jgi:hypothetical protein